MTYARLFDSSFPFVLLGVGALAGGCDDSSRAPGAGPSASSSALPAMASAPAAMAPPSATATASAKPEGPSMKEYAEPAPDRLGKLAPGLGIAVGQRAPDAEVHDATGKPIHLADLYKKSAVLLAFYRGGWCPYCSYEIHDFAQSFAEYQRRGVTPVAISVDKEDEASKTQATFAITFPVLSDPDLHAINAFHVAHKADDAEYAKLKGYGLELEKWSGRAHHTIAVPSYFLVDTKGVVRWAHADPEYKVRPKTAQLLAAIDAAKLSPPAPVLPR